MPEDASVNTDAPSEPVRYTGYWRVREIQAKLHEWAAADPGRRFDDLFGLVTDPAFLYEAWERVRGNKGARTTGVDHQTVYDIENRIGVETFLAQLREDLRSGQFKALPVREAKIPKANGKLRRLGIPTLRDRVVQGALKLVLEPVFEADFRPCSYGFRPQRRAMDAIAEIHKMGTAGYSWVLDADIAACFDEISHPALMDRVRARIKDKKVLALVKSFLKAGVLTHLGGLERGENGTPQGGIISPLLANIALSVLDEHFEARWKAMGTQQQRFRLNRKGVASYRMVRYADDFVVMVFGTEHDAEAIRQEVTEVLAPMGLRLSGEKTRVVSFDQGFDFLGFRIQRHRKKGTNQHFVYTYPSKAALARIIGKVREATGKNKARNLANLIYTLNPVIRGWCMYFRYGVSKATFSYLEAYTWHRVLRWLRKRHPKVTVKELRRRFLPDWRPTDGEARLYYAVETTVTRYRYRGTRIPNPFPRVSVQTA
jgi:RNA-directed DNA polymerase